jgi:pimeloyl-ACP methyl ester carboxylesterase
MPRQARHDGCREALTASSQTVDAHLAPAEPLAWSEYGAGAPLLLIHGDFSDGLGAWGGNIAALAQSRRVLAVDRRGHGASPREPRPYTIEEDAADLVELLDRAGIDAAHVAGHSYGGLVAAELAAVAPERVLTLHLIEPPWLALGGDDPDVRSLDAAVRRLHAHAGMLGPEGTAAAFFTQLTAPDGLAALRASSRWQGIVREAARFAEAEYGGDYPADRIERLDPALPLAVYRGGRSHPALRAIAAEIVRRRPGARLISLPDAGHAVQQSAAFNALLLEGTEETERPGRSAENDSDGGE